MQPNQSTRERWNLQQSFSDIVGPSYLTFLCQNYFPAKTQRRNGRPSAVAFLLCAFAPLRENIFFELVHPVISETKLRRRIVQLLVEKLGNQGPNKGIV